MSLERRLRVLEDHAPEPEQDRSEIREWMRESLHRIAACRRGALGPEETAEVEAEIAVVKRAIAKRRGEGGR